LQHYGFIVMTEAGCLGVNGKGKAPHWRLTEIGYMHEQPTKDFLKWDGEMFHEQKSPEYYKRQERRLAKLRAGRKTESRTSPRCRLHQPTVHTTAPRDGAVTGKGAPAHGAYRRTALHQPTAHI
jgi:hypothetical protein